MADIADIAWEREEEHRARAIEAARRRMRGPSQRIENGRVLCRDCGKPIPAARLAALPRAARCLPCQKEAEA